MANAAEVGCRMWNLTNCKTIQLLFAIKAIRDPIFNINEGTEEQEGRVFGNVRYGWCPQLRGSLGFPVWKAEQQAEFVEHKRVYLAEVTRQRAAGEPLPWLEGMIV
jgi:hypothetical protein